MINTLYWFMAASSSARACCLSPSSIPFPYWSLRDDAADPPNAELRNDEPNVNQMAKNWIESEFTLTIVLVCLQPRFFDPPMLRDVPRVLQVMNLVLLLDLEYLPCQCRHSIDDK